MADERTFGFNKDDAESILQGIGVGENWFPEIKPRGGSGGGSTIVFQPFEIVPGIGSWCVAVRSIVISAECGLGVQAGDVVNVWDRTEGADHFGVPLELLILMTGYAVKMKVSAAERYALPVDPGPCRYEVIRMNCTESEAVVY